MTRKGRWLLIAVAALGAFWPRFVDLSDWGQHPLAPQYEAEARMALSYLRGHPIQQVSDALLVQQWRFTNWREVPGSADGGVGIASLADVQVDATAIGPWGIPMARYTIGCGGACAQRMD